MKTKLTLSIDADIIKKAKSVTSRRKQSLSSIVEEYLKGLFAKPVAKKKEMTFTEMFRKKFPPPKVKMTDAEMGNAKHDYLMKKHG